MNDYSGSGLAMALKKIGLKKGDTVFSHSNVGFLGIPEEGKTPKAICETVLNAILETIGSEGTLVIPTFTYSFCNGDTYNVAESPSRVGLFSEYIRKHQNAKRSKDPIFSVSALGPKAEQFTSKAVHDCFGKGSIWETLHKENAALLNIGIEIGSTFIHYIEESLLVPYRYKKLFTGEIVENGEKYKSGIIYYVRDLNYKGAESNWSNLNRDARQSAIAKTIMVGRGEVSLIRAGDMFDLCSSGLQKNNSYLVNGLVRCPAGEVPSISRAGGLNEDSTMMDMINCLWNMPRDIVSKGYRQALSFLSGVLEIYINKYATGTECWTWIVPEEWECLEASLETEDGNRIFSTKDHPLHVMSYSLPYNGLVSREELFEHLYTNPRQGNAIPYKFKYYERSWGLCCSQKVKDSLKDNKYRVRIESKFSFGNLEVGDITVKGRSDRMIIMCAHLCHPFQANDDLSGVAVGMEVMRQLGKMRELNYSYKFLIVPETIGSIAWLSHNDDQLKNIRSGVFLEMLGTDCPHSLQLSFSGNSEIDHLSIEAVRSIDRDAWIGKHRSVVSNDENQFNAPGVRIPMISLSRVFKQDSGKYPYPEYHSSNDTPAKISEKNLSGSADLVLKMIRALENGFRDEDKYVINKYKGEVFASRYGIHIDYYLNPKGNLHLFDVMDYIDGTRTISEIARTCGISFNECKEIVDLLCRNDLVELSDDRRI